MNVTETKSNSESNTVIFNAFYDLAMAASDEIEVFNPEIIIPLAHGGWGVLWAVEALWSEIKTIPLPPTLVLNIGREKLERYKTIRPDEEWVHTYPFVAEYAGGIENGYFLAWLSKQTDWQDFLRAKVLHQLNGQFPKRIMVLDDGNFSGGTYRIILGLLQDVFPEADSSMLVGDGFEWKEEIAQIWLDKMGFSIEDQVKLIPEVCKLVTGTVDTDPDSLDWKTITADHPHLSHLSQYIPAEKLLALAEWTREQIQQGILNIYKQPSEMLSKQQIFISKCKLDDAELALRDFWLKKNIDLKNIAASIGVSTQEAQDMLSSLK